MKKKKLILLLILLNVNLISAQFIKEKSINAQIGFGLSSPTNSLDEVVDSGFFAQGEFVLKVTSWFELRPYAGILLTSASGEDINGNPTSEKAESNAFLLGGKVRLRAPIRWVAPYVEFGIGASIGKFETLTVFNTINENGIIYHIPFSLGLELGRNNNVDLGLIYYIQPSVEQIGGAVAIGLTFPLSK